MIKSSSKQLKGSFKQTSKSKAVSKDLRPLKNKDLSFPEIESGRGRVAAIGEAQPEEETSRKFKLKLSEMNVALITDTLNKRGRLN